MPRHASDHPTELELQLLKLLWEHGPQSAREVRDRLAEARDLAPTTVITMLNLMVEKKYLVRRRTKGGWVYRARVSENVTTRRMLQDLIDRAFGGSTSAALLTLIDGRAVDGAELRELRDLLDRAPDAAPPPAKGGR